MDMRTHGQTQEVGLDRHVFMKVGYILEGQKQDRTLYGVPGQ